MNGKAVSILVVVCLFTSVLVGVYQVQPAFATTQNYIVNGDFESGSTGWEVSPYGCFESSTSYKHSGAASLLDSTDDSQIGYYLEQTIDPPMSTNNFKSFSFWVLSSGGNVQFTVEADYNDSSGGIYTDPAASSYPSWTLFNLTSSDPNKFVNYIRITLTCLGGSNRIYMDDFVLNADVGGGGGIAGWNFEITNRELPNAPGLYYVFSEEKYYNFVATFYNSSGWSNFRDVYLYFADWNQSLGFGYDIADDTGSIIYGSDVVTLGHVTLTAIDSTHINVTFPLFFSNHAMDAMNIDVYLAATLTDNSTAGPSLVAAAYFSIYVVGGLSSYSVSGSAGRLPGGDVFDLYANSGSSANYSVTSTMMFRNLVHVKLQPMVNFTIPNDSTVKGFNISYGIDYITAADSTWITGFRIDMRAVEVAVGSGRWVTFSISLYNHGQLIL